ncbi:FtsW/RodA/SpoVE family cell cycle protein [Ligilactobacillus salitolerans]|nr:FtsW/RodA/SpoVE family cell cycle protein [Ligilactobacillus salitolerans]
MMKRIKEKLKYFDYYLFIPYIILCLVGVVMVYSASSINLSYNGAQTDQYLWKQLIFAVLGVCGLLTVCHLSPRWWAKSWYILFAYLALIVLLFIARFFTNPINGAHGWINLGPVSLQPSEFCKLYLTMFMARLMASREKGLANGKEYTTMDKVKPYLLVVFMLGFILSAPDLGGFMINLAIVLVIASASTNNGKISYQKRSALWGVILAGFFGAIQVLRIWNPLENTPYAYMHGRFQAFFDPFSVAQSSGKQLVNSYYAISNGGLFGLGLGNSIQKRGYLPEPYTDFILSVITEELGFVGALVILLLICFLTLRVFLIGIRSQNTYNSLFCYGIGTFILVETCFNIGGVLGLLPITGVTLPFISYGGSSMIVLSLALGMVMNISANQRRGTEFDLLDR